MDLEMHEQIAFFAEVVRVWKTFVGDLLHEIATEK